MIHAMAYVARQRNDVIWSQLVLILLLLQHIVEQAIQNNKKDNIQLMHCQPF